MNNEVSDSFTSKIYESNMFVKYLVQVIIDHYFICYDADLNIRL